MSPREQYCWVSFGWRFFPLDSSSSKILSWPVPRVYLMSTCVRSDSGLGLTWSHIVLYTSTLAVLTTCAWTEPLSPSPSPLSYPFRRLSPFHLLFSVQREDMPMRALASLPRSVQGERDALKVQSSFLKRARSIVRSFSKGSRGIACRKPFISVSAEACPSRLPGKKERKRRRENSSASFDKVSLT